MQPNFVVPEKNVLKKRGAVLIVTGIIMLAIWILLQSFSKEEPVQDVPASEDADVYMASYEPKEGREEGREQVSVENAVAATIPVNLIQLPTNSEAKTIETVFFVQKEEPELNFKKTTEEYSSDVYTGIILFEEGVSPSFLRKVESNYIKVPENVRNHFQENGWVVFVSKQPLSSRFSFGSILGLLDADTKTIYIDNREKAAKTVLHEMGHYVDSKCGIVSRTEEFIEIYESEIGSFCQIHSTNKANVSTPTEYFAECYEVYLQSPDILRNACPRTAAFIEENQSKL